MPVVRTGGLSVYGHVITKFSRMGRLLPFLTHGAALARFARESSAMNQASKVCAIANAAITFIQMAVMLYCYGSLVRGLYFSKLRETC